MATCREIVTRAYQVGGIVSLGVDPKAREMDLGMEALQSLFDMWVEQGMFGRLKDVYKTANYTAREYERVIAPSAITVTKPTTISGQNRAPYDLACIVTILNGTQTNYIYTQGDWTSLTGLAEASECPLSYRDRHGFSCRMAMEYPTMFGANLGAPEIQRGRRFQASIMQKFGVDNTPVITDDYGSYTFRP